LGNISITRERSGDIVELTIDNYTGRKVALDITEMISKIPKNISQGVLIDMENEWFLKWSPSIKKNESKTLTYNVEEDAIIELDIGGSEKENITVKI
jgi:DNA topoisomerase-6 subunit B